MDEPKVLTHPRFDRPPVHQPHPRKRKGTVAFPSRSKRAKPANSGEYWPRLALLIPTFQLLTDANREQVVLYAEFLHSRQP